MSRKQAIILLIFGLFLAFLLIKPYNYLCKTTGLCSEINPSYHILAKKGDKYFDFLFETKNSSKTLEFKALSDIYTAKSGQDIVVKYEIRNLSDKKITARPKRYVFPPEALKYIEFHECLCFKSYKIAAKSREIIEVRFKVDPKIEKDSFFKDKKEIKIGYEI
jgi:cytochrome c oxidase assembly protein Cox11